MKKRCANFLLLIVILLSGYGHVAAHTNELRDKKTYSPLLIRAADKEQHLDKNHWFETFKRKGCLVDNEEIEENFSAAQKQLVKSNYFLNFLSDNKLTLHATVFTKRGNYCKAFSLLSNKVYLLFQVFRI